MGDVGSLALGGAIGSVAVITKQEILLVIVGGLFVIETLSVIIQVASFKLRGQARLPHGADPPPLRARRLGRAEGHRPLLDPGRSSSRCRALDAEAAMNERPGSSTATVERVLVFGLGLVRRAPRRACCSPRGRRSSLAAADEAVDAGDARASAASSSPPASARSCRRASTSIVVVSPGVPLDAAAARRRAAPGMPVIAEVELAFPFLDGADRGDHRHATARARRPRSPARCCARPAAPSRSAATSATPLVGQRRRTEPRPVFVVELSSFQLEGIATLPAAVSRRCSTSRPTTSTATRAWRSTPPPRSGSSRARTDGIAVLNADDPRPLAVATRARRRFFSRLGPVADGCGLRRRRPRDRARAASDAELFAAADVPLAGVPNVENAMAAALLARALGAAPAAIRDGLRGFTGCRTAMERVRRARRRRLVRRLEGHQRRRHAEVARGLRRRHGPPHPRRPRQGRATSRALRRWSARNARRALSDRRGRRRLRAGAGRGRADRASVTLDNAVRAAAGRRGRARRCALAGVRQLRPVQELR